MVGVRELEENIRPVLNNANILLVQGGRFVGKTAMMKRFCEDLRAQGHPVASINLENLKYLMKLEKDFGNLFRMIDSPGAKRTYLLLEEIQNLSRPVEFLKYIDERYRDRIKLLVTASYDKFENPDPRFWDQVDVFQLHTLNFREFLTFRQREDLLAALTVGNKGELIPQKQIPEHQASDIKLLLEEFVKFGGYPDVVREKSEEEKVAILEDIYNTFLLKDVEKKRIHNKPKLYAMIRNIAETTSLPLNQNGIANSLGLSITAVENYLDIVERAFFVRKVRPFARSFSKEIRKMPKMYFLDNGIRNLILDNFEAPEERMDKEGCFENIVYTFLLAHPRVQQIHYWRTQTKHEVDFILNRSVALEVEFNGNLFKKSKFKQFFKNYPDFPFHVLSQLNRKDTDHSLPDLI